jgi:N-acetylglucosamine kinase-like BadF-type ATPase
MILIADSGSSKTDWAYVDAGGHVAAHFVSEGYNPNYITQQYMIDDIRRCLPPTIDCTAVDAIYFYGAGVTELQFDFVREALQQLFPAADRIEIAMDLLASARALLGREPGFAAILGTGTNTCLYDGTEVTLNIDSCGFILGDEGSGAYLGKRLLVDYIRGTLPLGLYPLVGERIRMSGNKIIDEVYTKPFPNRFCAQYAPFIRQHLKRHPYFYSLVEDSFHQLFQHIVCRYPYYAKYRFNCVGSVGYHFRPVLEKVATHYGMEMGRVLQYPLEGLVEFHTTN